MNKYKIRTGDKVKVIAGKNKGKIGSVLKILSKKNRVIVSGIQVVKKHIKPSQKSQGGIVQQESSIHISNVAYVDPKTEAITKVGFKLIDNKKVRIAKKSGKIISTEVPNVT
jgi:large subunit ribosomal protein L24